MQTNTGEATKRTAWNAAAIAAVIGSVSYAVETFTDVDVPDLDLVKLAPLFPVVGVVVGIGYRLSRAISDRWPVFGKILFGSNEAPVYGENKEG